MNFNQILKMDRKGLIKFCKKTLLKSNMITQEELDKMTKDEQEQFIISKALEMYQQLDKSKSKEHEQK